MRGSAELFYSMAMFVTVAIVLAVTFTYLTRPGARARFPGGAKRYLAALIVQATGFMTPMPVVLLLLFGQPIAPGLDVVIAVVVGVGVLALLHLLPMTGPLLKDLRRSRLEAAMARISGGEK